MQRCVRTELATINKLFRLPGTMLRRNVHGEPISDWSPELLTIFEERIDARDAVKLEKKKRSTGAGVLQEEGEGKIRPYFWGAGRDMDRRERANVGQDGVTCY